MQSTTPRPSPNASFCPQADTATYRDLLLFEERLKMNAEMLWKRRRRYQVFLWTFIASTLMMSYRLIFKPPSTFIYLRSLQGALIVVLITLILFFASGMYEEKIRYARGYLAHSNKALRPLNLYLNTRRPPFLSTLSTYLPSLLTTILPIPSLTPSPSSVQASAPDPKSKPSNSLNNRRSSHSSIMAQMPPSVNPRGELIFSSRVSKTFREGYERYRAAFERRRAEKIRLEALSKGWFGFNMFWLGIGGTEGSRHGRQLSVSPAPSPGNIGLSSTPPPGTKSMQ